MLNVVNKPMHTETFKPVAVTRTNKCNYVLCKSQALLHHNTEICSLHPTGFICRNAATSPMNMHHTVTIKNTAQLRS